MVNGARMPRKSAFLPGEACRQAVEDGNPNREVGLRRQESAEAIVPPPSGREGPNVEEDRNLSRSRDVRRRPPAPDRGTAGQTKVVKPRGDDQRAEPSPARDEGLSNAEGPGVWEQIFERKDLFAALKRVKENKGAPGIDGMTVEELLEYLRAHRVDIRAQLDAGSFQP